MTYYSDLSPFRSATGNISGKPLAIGWLDNKHEYQRGIVSDIFLEKLWLFCRYPSLTLVARGYHDCQLCLQNEKNNQTSLKSNFSSPLCVQRAKVIIKLGYAEISILSEDKVLYIAPNLIYHYVIEHKYYPPESFIQSLLASPLPNTDGYRKILKELGWRDVVDMAISPP